MRITMTTPSPLELLNYDLTLDARSATPALDAAPQAAQGVRAVNEETQPPDLETEDDQDPQAGEAPEAQERSQLVPRAEATQEAVALYRARPHGVLGTLSARAEQWPFASVVPYALDRLGRPVIYVASIAEHTRNLTADSRASLFLQPDVPPGVDAQTLPRLTLLGRLRPVPRQEEADAFARYVARLPTASSYEQTHDFSLWRMTVERARYIGGFGKIFWIEGAAFELDPAQDPLLAVAGRVVEHMNQDHADALVTYCQAFHRLSPARVEMLGVDQFGFDVDADGRRLRFDFPVPVGPETVRGAVVELLKVARARLAAG
jgi:putative heme iron utilization protein